jgi:hypothetical protein
MKTQTVRILDVVFIGPLMIWGGNRLRQDHPLRGLVLAALGAATIWYNGRNYLLVEDAMRRGEAPPCD